MYNKHNIVLAPSLVEKALAFTLDATVTNKPFGDNGAYINIWGPDGYNQGYWYNWTSIKTGVTSGMVTLNLPDDSFPIGGNYQVCVSSKQIMTLLPFYYAFNHQSDHESVIAPLEKWSWDIFD